jgi:hypothetical protein
MIDLNYNGFLLIWGTMAIIFITGLGLGYAWCALRSKNEIPK